MVPDPSPYDAVVHARLQAALGARLTIGSPLGRGGFGIVYAAEEVETGRAVAVKLLRPDLAAPLLRERFRREASCAARLVHPHIVPVLEVGEEGDLSWFLMPRISGETLRERLLREGRLPIGEARRIMLEVADALHAAHDAGLLHRDVKPDNILLEAPAGRALLTDFGIAKSLDGTGAGLTTAGAVVGTPQYMSPEQAGAEPVIGPQSDLYSLGVVTYQMLTGVLPFEGTSPGGILLRQVRDRAPPVARGRPECPASLAAAVDRCITFEPGERWEGAEDLIAALGRPSAVRSPGLQGTATDDDAASFRRGLMLGVGVMLAGAGVDLARGELLLAPLTAVGAAGVLAAWYGSLWTRGHTWRSLVLPARVHSAPAAPVPRTPADQMRSDRAFILRKLTTLPASERRRHAGLPLALDRAILALEAGGTSAPLVNQIARLRTALAAGAGFDDPAITMVIAELERGA
ncbi:MAG: serine/threonine protein kinase [Gemmatimonadetes bacterium]|nr:serine/threonine protein kinase [Gemmatimonadota bacterium]